VAHRKSAKVASKAEADKTTANAAPAAQDSDKQLPLPPTVANANAQMPGVTDTAAAAPPTEADTLANTAGKTLTARQNEPSAQPQVAPDSAEAAAAEVVPSDELNDVDRALNEEKPTTPTLALASIDAPPAATPAATNAAYTTGQSAMSEDSAWRQTSLIGKIFIAFGALLTMASAARMFMA
jgi:hypothetical protein